MAKPRIDIPAMRVSAEWNGDFAGSVDLPACDVSTRQEKRSRSSFPGAQESFFGEDADEGFMLGGASVGGKVEQPRLVLLPMHVPSVMKTNAETRGRGDCQLTAGMSFHQRGNRGGQSQRGNTSDGHGGGMGDSRRVQTEGDGSGSYSGADGGRTHRLRLTIGAEPRSPSSGHAESHGTSPEKSRETSRELSPEKYNNFDGGKTESVFFERDLLRKEWTEMFVPVSLQGHSRLSDCPNLLTHGQRGIRPGSTERCVRLRRGSRGNNRQNGYTVEKASSPEVFVVLQARSAGFHPDKPPLWLVRRDFAERAVRRIVSAAAAAVVQPRVEITLLGLRGAVGALLTPEKSSEDNRDTIDVRHKEGSSLPGKRERKLMEHGHEDINDRIAAQNKTGSSLLTKSDLGLMNHDRGEILCQLLWNGKIAHNIRLHRAHPPHLEPSGPTAIARDGAALCPSNRMKNSMSELGDSILEGKEDGCPRVFPPSFVTNSGETFDGKRKIAGRVGDLKQDGDMSQNEETKDDESEADKSKDWKLKDYSPNNQDATSWFAHSEQPLLDNWVSVATPSSSDETVRKGGERTTPPNPNIGGARNTGDEVRQRPGRGANQPEIDGKGGKTSPSPLVWVPAEADVYDGRPIRLFFPACLFGDDANAATVTSSDGGSLVGGEKGGGFNTISGSKTTEGDRGDRNVQGDAVTGDRGDGERTLLRGELRLVFWLESKTPDTNAGRAVGEKRTRSFGGGRAGEGGVRRKLLGCARLVDDELVLQPLGERVELALLGSAGLGMPAEWAASHTLSR